MLQGIRDRAQTWIMWIIVILLIIPFALWGIHQYFGPNVNVAVASVNGEDLSQRQFRDTYQRQRQRMQALLGSQFDINRLSESRLKEEALNRMIEEELIVQTALNGGAYIGDEQLARIIRTMDVFKVNEQFSQGRYESWLRNQGYAPGGFENTFRRSLLAAQLHTGITTSALIPDAEVDQVLRLMEQKRSFDTLTVQVARYLQEHSPDEAEIQAFYEAHPQAFMEPEQVQVRYLELTKEGIAAHVTVTDQQVKQRYEAQKDNYISPEKRRASHILLTLEEDAPQEEVARVEEKAKEILEKIKAGGTFKELAPKYSQDPATAGNGGDLGYFTRGTMSGPFEDAVFSMQEGAVSDPVRTEFGVHIIKLTGIQKRTVKPLGEVRESIRRELQVEQASQLFFDQAEQFANLVFENPDTLEVAAEALGLEIRETGFFTREGGEGIAAEPRVVDAAFSEEVLQGNNGEPLELGANRLVALHLKEHKPAAEKPLAQVREEVIDRLKQEHARKRAAEVGKGSLDALRAGTGPVEVATQIQLEWQPHEQVSRGEPKLDSRLKTKVFSLPRPSDKPTFGEAVLENGDFVIVALKAVQDGDLAKASPALRSSVRDRLLKAAGDEAYEAFVSSLRKRSDVRVFKDQM